MAEEHSPNVQAALEAALSRFVERNPESRTLHEEAVGTFPGGNTRTVLHTNPFPICISTGKGYQVTSEDGHTYTDLLGEFSAGLDGHSNPQILAAVEHVIHNVGLNLSATTAQEQRFAAEICRRFDLEQLRFANSGTEANLHAIAAARLFTKKRRVVAFSGGYHGGVIGFPRGEPAANNVDINDWIVAKYNDLEDTTQAIKSENVAAVILEGMQGAGGCICGTQDFLHGIQKAANEAGVIVILDEVMTSRVSTSGLAGVYGLQPDLKTLGKYLGGGLTFGAFGGRKEIMAVFDPRHSGSVAHSGTFNNNSLVTHAGYVGLTQVYTAEAAERFAKAGDQLMKRLNEATAGTKLCFTGLGTLMAVHCVEDGSRQFLRGEDVVQNQALKDLFWFEMLEHGFWLGRRGNIALVLDTPLAELDRFVSVVGSFVTKHKDLLAVPS